MSASDLSDWADDGDRAANGAPTGSTSSASSAIAAALAAVDIDAAMNAAVATAMRKRLDDVAAAAVDEILDDATLEQLRASADEAATAALLAAPTLEEPEAPAPELYYPTVLDFVAELLVPMYRRSLNGQDVTWCPEWWRHPEAITRLDALWRAWEHLRLDAGTGLSVWLRDHLDHHMAVLLSADGPLKGCTPDAHAERPLKPFSLTPPPDGLFDTL